MACRFSTPLRNGTHGLEDVAAGFVGDVVPTEVDGRQSVVSKRVRELNQSRLLTVVVDGAAEAVVRHIQEPERGALCSYV